MSVSKCPISACKLEGRDEVLLQSSSTKAGTLCPASCRSVLGHQRWSKDEMYTHEVDPLESGEGYALLVKVELLDLV